MKIGSLFSGYGGLDLAVEAVFNAQPAWFCEFDDAPSKILAHHWPKIPNHRDVTTINWEEIEPVDIITGGSPCQDLSQAGKRAGMTEGTRSNLWVNMREAIATLQPKFVVWENVLGALSATATSDSDLEQGGGLLAAPGGGHLRALGRVLGDLAEIGYDAKWTTLRASDIGAPHHRARVFLIAQHSVLNPGHDAGRAEYGQQHETPTSRVRKPSGGIFTDTGHEPGRGRSVDLEAAAGARQDGECKQCSDGNCTPANTVRGGQRERHGQPTLSEESIEGRLPSRPQTEIAQHHHRVSPLPNSKCEGRQQRRGTTPSQTQGGRTPSDTDGRYSRVEWGRYAPAVRRWEEVTRPAPNPTELNTKGNPRLHAPFAEWMMGLPVGWVTDPEIGLTRTQQLKAIGNGVCVPQGIAALQQLLNH